jgi:ribosomal protein S17E
VEYLGSISGKNLKRITREIHGQYFCKQFEGEHWEIFVGYFEEDFRENIDHYTLFVDINSQTNILK